MLFCFFPYQLIFHWLAFSPHTYKEFKCNTTLTQQCGWRQISYEPRLNSILCHHSLASSGQPLGLHFPEFLVKYKKTKNKTSFHRSRRGKRMGQTLSGQLSCWFHLIYFSFCVMLKLKRMSGFTWGEDRVGFEGYLRSGLRIRLIGTEAWLGWLVIDGRHWGGARCS